MCLYNDPFKYGIYSPIIVGLFILYYVLFYGCMNKFESYTDSINKIMDNFEAENKCKIRIRKRRKKFEVNWKPNLLKLSKKKKKKAKAKGSKIAQSKSQSNKEEENIDITKNESSETLSHSR